MLACVPVRFAKGYTHRLSHARFKPAAAGSDDELVFQQVLLSALPLLAFDGSGRRAVRSRSLIP